MTDYSRNDPYYCFGNKCPRGGYNQFIPRLRDDSLYPIKHSTLNQYGSSKLSYGQANQDYILEN